MMDRGVLMDQSCLAGLEAEVATAMKERIGIVEGILGAPLDKLNDDGEPTFFRSTPQIKALMERLGQRPGTNRKTKRDSYDDEVLFRIGKRTPGLAPLCNAIIEYRSLGTMRSNFLRARLDPDGRMRCSWNTAGPETFRWASSKNAFWRGTNLENIAKPFHALTGTPFPNLRRAIVFDPGHVGWEPDLAGADARVVAWDADDALMKQLFREGWSIHAQRAKEIYGASAGEDGRKEPYYTLAKKGGHLWNYGGKARTMAASLGVTVAEADKIIKRLSALHPGVVAWHKRVSKQLAETNTITNAFGYRIIYFKRPDEALTDALAWIGQGTVACAINRAMVNIDDGIDAGQLPNTEFLMQQHDSLVGQTRAELWPAAKPLIKAAFERVVIPYPDPLVIPPDLKTSTTSWGNMEKEKWQ
jgi:DNA polymerase I-like protein with 3'-5' exonuclease and polymerase domains